MADTPVEGEWYVKQQSALNGHGLNGHGLFARKEIPRGQRILSEFPLVKLQQINAHPKLVLTEMNKSLGYTDVGKIKDFETGLQFRARDAEADHLGGNDRIALNPKQQRPRRGALYRTLLSKGWDKWLEEQRKQGRAEPSFDAAVTLVGMFQQNCFKFKNDATQGLYTGLFLTPTLLNHSCRPNCHVSWEPIPEGPPGHGQLVVRATRKIEAGRELTIMYDMEVLVFGTHYERRKYLKIKYGFSCRCSACEGNEDFVDNCETASGENNSYNARRIESRESTHALVEVVERMIKWLNVQEIDNWAKGLLHSDLANRYWKLNRGDKAVEHFQEALNNAVTCFGESSYMALCCRSLLQQTQKALENGARDLDEALIGVDQLVAGLNASPREMRAMLASWDAQV